MIDIAVIGAGPAGYSAAITARKRDQSVVVIGQNTGWLARAEHVANYPGLPDISGRDLLSAMANQAQALGAELRPGVVHQVIAMGDSFALSLGADFIEAEGVILCTGASYHMSMEKVIADTVHIYRLMNLPKAAELPPEAVDGLEACVKEHGAALITGALTDTMVLPLLRSGVLRRCRLVVKDPSKVLLSADTLDKLVTREVALETEEAARTLCITVNPVSAYGWKFDKDEFLHRMREAVDVPVINVKEELA